MKQIDKSESFNVLYGPYYRINKNSLKLFGCWPYQSPKTRATIVFMVCFGIITVVIPEVIFFVKNIRIMNMNKIVDCIPNLILTYGAYVMIANSVINHHKMKKTLFKIKDDWIDLKEENELSILRKYTAEDSSIASLVLFVTEPLLPFALDVIIPLNESRPVRTILEVDYLVDLRKFYIPIYFHNLQAAYGVIFTVLTCDFYFVMVVQHSCAMFRILSYRIANINRKPMKDNYWNHKSQKIPSISTNIGKCIDYHLECISFADLIEDTFTVSWILQLSLNVLLISFIGVQTITRTNDPLNLIKYAMTTISIIVRLFYISWPGQKMYDHSTQIHNDLCNIPWYDFPQKSKLLLILMMLRSSKPCSISAGKMIYLNFDTYCTLMKTSGSYFTMILSTQ